MNVRQMADKVQSKGRHGDSMLVHMHPAEVAGIASLTPGGLTINPDTGKPEAFAFLLPALMAWGGTAAAGAAGMGMLGTAAMAGLGSAAGTKVIGGSNQDALLAGLLAGTTAGVMHTPQAPVMPATPATPVTPTLPGGATPLPGAMAPLPGAMAPLPGAATPLSPQPGMGTVTTSSLANPAPPPMATPKPTIMPDGLPTGDWGGIGQAPGGSIFQGPAAGGDPYAGGTSTGMKSMWDKFSPMQKTLGAGAALAAGTSLADSIDRNANPYEPPGKKVYDTEESFPSDEENRAMNYTPAAADYGHGFVDEWSSFGYAEGGMLPAAGAGIGALAQQGAPPQGAPQEDPQAQLFQAAAAVVSGQITGEPAQAIIQQFVQVFGQEALDALILKVSEEMKGGQQGRMVEGPPSPEGVDNIPGMVDGQEPVGLQSGEYIMPRETVAQVGKPNLDALVQQTTGKPPVGAEPRREILPRVA